MNKMEVKCPKCRYRFEIELPQGVSALSCVCVRCGTPFTHVVETADGDAIGGDALSPGNQSGNDRRPAHLSGGANTAGEGHGRQAGDGQSAWQRAQSLGAQANIEWSNPYPNRRSRHASILPKRISKGFLLRIFLVLAVAAGLLYVFKTCSRDESYDYADLEARRMPRVEVVDTVRPLPKMASSKRAVATPQWIYGTWRAQTDYGEIEIRLADIWIRETIDGETTHGRFFYTKGQINCVFNKCDSFVYRVDDKLQRIDAGDGIWMSKISNR